MRSHNKHCARKRSSRGLNSFSTLFLYLLRLQLQPETHSIRRCRCRCRCLQDNGPHSLICTNVCDPCMNVCMRIVYITVRLLSYIYTIVFLFFFRFILFHLLSKADNEILLEIVFQVGILNFHPICQCCCCSCRFYLSE